MWTYMMAAARGDRANSMMASRRRNESESPKYGYNLSRPMYRSIRHNNGPSAQCHTTTLGGSYPYTTATSHYGSSTTSATSTSGASKHQQQQHQQQHQQLLQSHETGQHQHQQRSHHHIIGIDDDVYTNPVSNVTAYDDMEDSTSLFSPLAPTSTSGMPVDTAVLIARKHRLMSSNSSATNNSQMHMTQPGEMMMMDVSDEHRQQHMQHSSYVGSQAAVIRLPPSTSHKLSSTAKAAATSYYNESDEDDDYAQIVRCSSGDSATAASIRQSVIDHQRSIRKLESCGNNKAPLDGSGYDVPEAEADDDNEHVDDEDEDEDDAEEDDVSNSNGISTDRKRRRTNYLENGKRMSQDQTKRSKPSTLRRTLNALRQRLTKRNRPKPPDWFVERFSNNTNADKNEKQPASTQVSTTNESATAEAGPACEIRGSSRLCNRLSVNPSLQSHYRWLAVVSLAVLYNIIFVVGRAVFWEINQRATPVWYTLDYLCDFIYLMDTLVHMHEGYLDQGLLVRDAYKLRRHYFTNKGWYIDILSMLPTDISYIWWPPSKCGPSFLPCAVIVRLNRLLRLPRMWEWFDRTETATGYPNAFRICKVVLAILVLIHWNACMYFVISYALGFGTDNWVYNLNGERNSTLQRQYIYSFYWSTLTLTTIGETPTPENDAEYLFVVADFLAGVLIFATIVGNIGSMISNMNVARVEFQNRMDGVKQYMAFRKVGHELEARVIRWFAYTWSQSGALDEERVLAALPDKLKAEIAIQVHMDTLRQVRIFHDTEPGLLEALVLKLKLQVFSPGDYICRKGDVGKEMYIVKRGKLSVVADDGVTVFATLGAGSVFGEVSVLEIAGNRTGNRRTANVRSLGYSDLFCLAKRDLWETLADYPEARATLTERGCQLLRKDGLLDEQVFADSQRVHDTIESGIEKLEVSVENLNMRLARLLAEYTASQAKMKQRLAKLELNYQLTQSISLTEQHARPPRSGRLYSLQPKKRPRSRPASASKSNDNNKQNTL
ncbi:cyclic nucleotide-gated cation channel subunit A isoform X1 [Stomoxys calcitrans]|uniref:cyclic nucleotide-gated cation channel subunit A isoform X1 n=1 Tax=Stomoxys calcitrans TaxID=35570 RepID=UPI0027E32BFF|nr:cyclic nucleotide-gated cation channel subunit A isoform X1 [Stomoxys calcitrans]